MPVRKTKFSVGYDIEAAEDVVIHPFKLGDKPVLVPTGLKAYCQPDEWYMLANRSSNPFKKGLVLANGIGLIDCDYYGNPDNDGHIMFAYYNFFPVDVTIKKHEVAGQGFFQKFLITDDDNADGKRMGGFGSTDKKA